MDGWEFYREYETEEEKQQGSADDTRPGKILAVDTKTERWLGAFDELYSRCVCSFSDGSHHVSVVDAEQLDDYCIPISESVAWEIDPLLMKYVEDHGQSAVHAFLALAEKEFCLTPESSEQFALCLEKVPTLRSVCGMIFAREAGQLIAYLLDASYFTSLHHWSTAYVMKPARYFLFDEGIIKEYNRRAFFTNLFDVLQK